MPEYFELREDYGVINGHVNLVVLTKIPEGGSLSDRSGLTIDFDESLTSRRFDQFIVPRKRIIAMYYNNKGAEALIAHRDTEAYAYLRAALLQDPNFIPTWGNLGILYRHIDKGDSAEALYRSVLDVTAYDRAILENLAVLLKSTGREKEAGKISWSVEKKRKESPYYQYYLGEIEYKNKNWLAAKKHYLKAIKLAGNVDFLYFGLAKTYYQMGDNKRTERYLKKAKKYSVDDDSTERYQNKLHYLNNL